LEWLDETALFIADYIADYDKAMEYDNKALEIYSEVQTKMKESEK
jgi:hypothetical protein